jgi:rsbT co-antagonist protein RsbR
MNELLSLEDETVQRRRYTILIWSSVFGIGLFGIFSLIDVLKVQTVQTIINFLLDALVILALLRARQLLGRVPIDQIAVTLTLVALVYTILNVVVGPSLLIRIIFLPLLAISSSVPYVSSVQLRFLSFCTWGTSALIFWLSTMAQTHHALLDFIAYWLACGIVLLIMYLFQVRMHEMLAQTAAAKRSLQQAYDSLEVLVEERTRSLHEAMSEAQTQSRQASILQAETEAHRLALQMLSTPVLPIGFGTLVVPLVGVFDQERMLSMQERILTELQKQARIFIVLDITGLTVVDNDVANGLIKIAQAVNYMGTKIILAGVRPELAQAIISNGTYLEGMQTVTTLEEGLELVRNYKTL